MMWNNENLINTLKMGGVVVMPTDTIYGIVGRAENEETVNRIYSIRKRNPEKPCIILIGDVSELKKFYIVLSEQQKNIIKEFWPFDSAQDKFTPVSIILDCVDEKFLYLHRGTKTLAFRVPAQKELRELLFETGPLIAPSANTEGLPPSVNITEAKKYFGDKVDLYIDGGEIKAEASKVIRVFQDGSVETTRA